MSGFNLSPDEFMELCESWKDRKVVVLGDLILDEYIFGRTGRVSREAPVVIVQYDGTSCCPGGGANAAANVAAMGGKVSAVGVTGNDSAGGELRDQLESRGVSTSGIISMAGRETVLKTRIMAGDFHAQRQQIVRIDRENSGYLNGEDESRLIDKFYGELSGADAVILSDYNQKLLSGNIIRKALELAGKERIPVFTDSRFRLTEFAGITGATPNEVELSRAAGVEPAEENSIDQAANLLLQKLRMKSLIVTRGSCGMSLYRPGKKKFSIPVVGSRAATDVTGAGDTVVAVVSLAVAAGAGMERAMMAANAAASVVVMKRGTAVATVREVYDLLEEHSREQQAGS
ncbi:MAG: hypothetical protein GF417_02715 [Candidatus Latescibacteria bacterium]|nr:hypothetical protein [bacterium]MBD3423342.1 hypothetical protein [Candidatus Latescibacterota bacterium]